MANYSTFSIPIFFNLLCILSLILAPKVVSVFAPLCKQYKDIGVCPDVDEDPLFPLCAERCKDREGVNFAICYIREELEILLKSAANYDTDNTEVTNDSSAGIISADGNNIDSGPYLDLQPAAPLKCFCCMIPLATSFAPEEEPS